MCVLWCLFFGSTGEYAMNNEWSRLLSRDVLRRIESVVEHIDGCSGKYEPGDCSRVSAIVETIRDMDEISDGIYDKEVSKIVASIWGMCETRSFKSNREYVAAVIGMWFIMTTFPRFGDWLVVVSDILGTFGSVPIESILQQVQSRESEIARWEPPV
jgi:hypothetical protein